MKSPLSFALAAALTLFLAACAEPSVDSDPCADGHLISAGTCQTCGADCGFWHTFTYTDATGQQIGEQFISPLDRIPGTFRSDTVTDEILGVEFQYSCNDRFSISLYQYDTNSVTTAQGDAKYTITMRIPDGIDHPTAGWIDGNTSQIIIDDPYKDELLDALQGKGELSLQLETAASNAICHFTIPTSNFAEQYAARPQHP